jgi:hypothetical protein
VRVQSRCPVRQRAFFRLDLRHGSWVRNQLTWFNAQKDERATAPDNRRDSAVPILNGSLDHGPSAVLPVVLPGVLQAGSSKTGERCVQRPWQPSLRCIAPNLQSPSYLNGRLLVEPPQTYNRTACCNSSSAFSSSSRPVRALPASVFNKASAIGPIP